MASWMAFVLVVYTTYAGNLNSMLAVPDSSLPINVSFYIVHSRIFSVIFQ